MKIMFAHIGPAVFVFIGEKTSEIIISQFVRFFSKGSPEGYNL